MSTTESTRSRSSTLNTHYPRWKIRALQILGMNKLLSLPCIEEDLEAYTFLIAHSMREIIRNRLDGSPEVVAQERLKIKIILDLHRSRLKTYLKAFKDLKTDQVIYAENHCVFAAFEVFHDSVENKAQ